MFQIASVGSWIMQWTNKKEMKKITYLGPKLCGNSTFALDRAISEPYIGKQCIGQTTSFINW